MMLKLKFLLISLLILVVRPVQSCDFWRDTKQFVLRNSGKFGLVIAAATVAYYVFQDDDRIPEQPEQPEIRFRSILPRKNTKLPKISEETKEEISGLDE